MIKPWSAPAKAVPLSVFKEVIDRIHRDAVPIDAGFQEGIARIIRERDEAIETFLRSHFASQDEAIASKSRLLIWHHDPDLPGGFLGSETVFLIPDADDNGREQWDWKALIEKYPYVTVRTVVLSKLTLPETRS